MIALRSKGHVRTVRVSPAAVPHVRLLGDARIANLPTEHRLPSIHTDQGAASSCTGFGYAKGPVETWARARGLVTAPVSALAAYTGGRQEGLGNAPLMDGGADPSRVLDFALQFGLLPESVRPYTDDPAVVNRKLTPRELEIAALFRVEQFAMITATGSALADAALQALAADLPVPFGMDVCASYEALRGPSLYAGPQEGEHSEGGHAQYLSGFRWNPARNAWDFEVTGSWADWGDDEGKVWITDTFLTSDHCFDHAVLKYTQLVVES